MEYETYGGGGYDDIYSDGNESYMNPYEDFEYSVYVYPGFAFERPVYMYIWGILVTIMFFANILVISVLLRKKMRNATNLILVAIAISDSMTGLVTLPSYWAVYDRYIPAEHHRYNSCEFSNFTAMGGMEVGDGSFVTNGITESSLHHNWTIMASTTVSDPPINTTLTTSFPPSLDTNETPMNLDPVNRKHFTDSDNETSPDECHVGETTSEEGYSLPKTLCQAFMISKFFLSKLFHTISIWLTLFLGFQRFFSVSYPFNAQRVFSKRNVIIVCVIICILAPILHVYHLLDEKAVGGWCQWESEEGCGKTCAYIIVTFIFRHFLPCFMLTIFTILFIVQLTRSSSRVSQADSNKGNASMRHRNNENRRLSIVVIMIVVFFLIPEIPYGVFLCITVIKQITEVELHMILETNRKIHLAYEISLILSFHANFYIYTLFNRRFRQALIKNYLRPILKIFGVKPDSEVTSSFSGTRRKTTNTVTNTNIEMKSIINPSVASISNHSQETSGVLNGQSNPAEEENGERSQFLKKESKGIYPPLP